MKRTSKRDPRLKSQAPSFWHELSQPGAWHRLVTWLLLLAFVLASVPPVWALQSPPPSALKRPAPGVSRAALEQALAMAGQSARAFDPRPVAGLDLPEGLPLEGSWFPSLTPRLDPASGPRVPASAPKEPSAERFEPGPEPPDRPEPVLSSRRARRGLARVFSPNDVPPPSDDWARQAHPAARLESISTSRQAFTVDHLVYHGRTYPLQNPGTTRITWDFLSPVAEHNATSRNSAGSIQLTYSSTGADPTDFSARSTTEIRVWDREHPGGKRVLRQTTPAQREELFAYAAIAAHDPGVWTVREDRDGQLTEETFLVAEPPTPSAEWVSRVKGQYLDLGEPLIGYVNDDWLLRSRTYLLPAPDNTVADDTDQGDSDDPEDFACRHPERQKRFRAAWDWRSPDSDLNETARRSYYSVKLAYRTDGESYRLRVKVWDRDDPQGRLVKDETGPGTLPAYTLTAGTGLETYGNWSLKETLTGQKKAVTRTLEARQLVVTTPPTGQVFFPDNDETRPFKLKIDTFPASYTPPALSWRLRLEDGATTLRSYSGSVESPGSSSLELSVPWDNRDANGNRVGVGSSVTPRWEVEFADPRFNEARASLARARVNITRPAADLPAPQPTPFLEPPPPSPRRTASTLALEEDGDYLLFGDFPYSNENPPPDEEPSDPGFILADDELRVFLNGEQIFQSEDLFAQTTEPPIAFNAQVGDELRVEVEDVHGICRRVSRLFLRHVPSGETIELDPGMMQCDPPSDPIGVFFNKTFVINLPGGGNEPLQVTDHVTGETMRAQPADSAARLYTEVGSPSDGYSRQVNLTTGTYRQVGVDVALATRGLPIVIARTYLGEVRDTYLAGSRNLTPGFMWSFERHLRVEPPSPGSAGSATYVRADGGEDPYLGTFSGPYLPGRVDMTSSLTVSGNRFYTLTFKDHTQLVFERADPDDTIARLVREVDRNGNTNTYNWVRDGRGTYLFSIQDPAGRTVRLDYNTRRTRIESIVDWAGRRVDYDYTVFNAPDWSFGNLDGLLTRVTLPGNKVYRFLWDQKPYLESVPSGLGPSQIPGEHYLVGVELESQGTRERNVQTTPVRTPTGNAEGNPLGTLKSLRTADQMVTSWQELPGSQPRTRLHTASAGQNRAWFYELDNRSRVEAMTDPLGGRSSFSYDARSNVVQSLNALNQEAVYTWDADRNPTSVRDQVGQTTRFTWVQNDLHRIEDPAGNDTLLSYDSSHNLLAVQDPDGEVSRFTYDANGLMTSSQEPSGQTWSFSYNGNGYLTAVTAPSTASSPASTWTFAVDQLGRRIAASDPNGSRWTYAYNVRDHLVSMTLPSVQARGGQSAQGSATLTYEWSPTDLLLAATDPLGRRTRYEYDDARRLVRWFEPGVASPTGYTYDGQSNLIAIRNPNEVLTNFGYDEKNRLVHADYPGSPRESFVYDILGNLKRWNKSDGGVIVYEHDALNRLERLSGQGTVITLTYDTLSRVTEMQDDTGLTRYAYDRDSQLREVTRPSGRRLTYLRDASDRVVGVRDPEGEMTTYQYDDRDQMVSASLDGQTIGYDYDALGRLTGTSYPNGFTRSLEYDERSRLVAMHYRRGSAQPLYSALYDHDQVGNRVTQLKTRASGTETLAHSYSERDELLRTIKNQATTVNYRFDDNYNRLLAGPTTEAVNSADQLTGRNTPAGGESFSYDSGGKMTRRNGPGGTTEYDYNWSDQITRVRLPGGTSINAYDGNGQRVQKREPDGRLRDYLWSGDEILKEYDESGTPQATYLLGLGREATRVDGAWHFYVTDGQGSTVFLLDAAGNVSASYDYDDWGNLASSSGLVYNPFLYTGQQFDADTGLYYLRARFYAPDIGRFTSRDPIGYAGGSNLYAYCEGNPVNCVDPSGLEVNRVYFGRHGDPDGMPPIWLPEQVGPVRQAGNTVVVDNFMTWQRAKSALTGGNYDVVTTALHSDSGTSLHFTQPEGRITWPTLKDKITAKAFIANGCVAGDDKDFQALAIEGSGRIVAGWTEMLGYNEYSGFTSRFVVLIGEGKSANEALNIMRDQKNSAGDPLFPVIGSFKVFGDVDKRNLLGEDR